MPEVVVGVELDEALPPGPQQFDGQQAHLALQLLLDVAHQRVAALRPGRPAACPDVPAGEQRRRVVAMRDGSEQFRPERVDARLALRLLAGEQPLGAVLAHPEEDDAVTAVRVVARRRRRTAIEGSTVSEGLPWSGPRMRGRSKFGS